MPVTERQIRTAIVDLILTVDGAGNVFDRLRKPSNALLSELNSLTVDDTEKINVVFVRRVAFSDEVSGFDDFIAASETYEIWFYRGVLDADSGADSESQLQLFIENVRIAFRAATHLLLTTPGFMVSQGGMGTQSPLLDTDELGGRDCHRFIGRLMVSIAEC